jgi:hypothetical protein
MIRNHPELGSVPNCQQGWLSDGTSTVHHDLLAYLLLD